MSVSRYVHRTAVAILVADLILVLSLFLVPFTEDPGTVRGLDARANAIDHWDRWKGMDPFSMIVYTFGDLNCHQMEERTIIINDNQMPVCSRDVGVFIGFIIGAAVLIRARVDDNPWHTIASRLPKGLKKGWPGRHPLVVVTSLLVILVLPTALDGGTQLLSMIGMTPFDYESTNPLRLITGFPLGVAMSLVITSLFMSLLSRRDEDDHSLMSYMMGNVD